MKYNCIALLTFPTPSPGREFPLGISVGNFALHKFPNHFSRPSIPYPIPDPKRGWEMSDAQCQNMLFLKYSMVWSRRAQLHNTHAHHTLKFEHFYHLSWACSEVEFRAICWFLWQKFEWAAWSKSNGLSKIIVARLKLLDDSLKICRFWILCPSTT